jgi:hypothetical protein
LVAVKTTKNTLRWLLPGQARWKDCSLRLGKTERLSWRRREGGREQKAAAKDSRKKKMQGPAPCLRSDPRTNVFVHMGNRNSRPPSKPSPPLNLWPEVPRQSPDNSAEWREQGGGCRPGQRRGHQRKEEGAQ